MEKYTYVPYTPPEYTTASAPNSEPLYNIFNIVAAAPQVLFSGRGSFVYTEQRPIYNAFVNPPHSQSCNAAAGDLFKREAVGIGSREMKDVGRLLLEGDVKRLKDYRINGKPLSQKTMPLVVFPGSTYSESPFNVMIRHSNGQGYKDVISFIIESRWFADDDFRMWIRNYAIEPEFIDLSLKLYMNLLKKSDEGIFYYFSTDRHDDSAIKGGVIRWASNNAPTVSVAGSSVKTSEYTYCKFVEYAVGTLNLNFGISDIQDVGGIDSWLHRWCPRCREIVLDPSRCIRPHNHSDIYSARVALLTAMSAVTKEWIKVLRCFLENCGKNHQATCDILGCYKNDTANTFWEYRDVFSVVDVNVAIKTVYKGDIMKTNLEAVGEVIRLVSGLDRAGDVPRESKIDHYCIAKAVGNSAAGRISLALPDLVDTSKVSLKLLRRNPELFLQTDPQKMTDPVKITKLFDAMKCFPQSESCARHLLSSGPMPVVRNYALCKMVMARKKASPSCLLGIHLLRQFIKHYYADLMLIGMIASPGSALCLLDSNTLRTIIRIVLEFEI